MKENNIELKNKAKRKVATSDKLLFTRVKWNDGGITQLGTVIGVISEHGTKYLTIMSIFGKRCTVKMSKVKSLEENSMD